MKYNSPFWAEASLNTCGAVSLCCSFMSVWNLPEILFPLSGSNSCTWRLSVPNYAPIVQLLAVPRCSLCMNMFISIALHLLGHKLGLWVLPLWLCSFIRSLLSLNKTEESDHRKLHLVGFFKHPEFHCKQVRLKFQKLHVAKQMPSVNPDAPLQIRSCHRC